MWIGFAGPRLGRLPQGGSSIPLTQGQPCGWFPTMRHRGLEKALFRLGAFTGVAYLIVGVAGAIWPGHWDDAAASDQILWAVFLCGGGLMVLAGVRLLRRSPLGAATLVSIGAVLGALPIFWALLPLLLAFALIVLSVLYARPHRKSPAPPGSSRRVSRFPSTAGSWIGYLSAVPPRLSPPVASVDSFVKPDQNLTTGRGRHSVAGAVHEKTRRFQRVRRSG
jgi:hypothetical protein